MLSSILVFVSWLVVLIVSLDLDFGISDLVQPKICLYSNDYSNKKKLNESKYLKKSENKNTFPA